MARTLGWIGRMLAGAIVALTVAVTLRPAPADAFFWEAAGAVVNLGSGYAHAKDQARERAEVRERERQANLAEAVFGRPESDEPQTLSAWLAERNEARDR